MHDVIYSGLGPPSDWVLLIRRWIVFLLRLGAAVGQDLFFLHQTRNSLRVGDGQFELSSSVLASRFTAALAHTGVVTSPTSPLAPSLCSVNPITWRIQEPWEQLPVAASSKEWQRWQSLEDSREPLKLLSLPPSSQQQSLQEGSRWEV